MNKTPIEFFSETMFILVRIVDWGVNISLLIIGLHRLLFTNQVYEGLAFLAVHELWSCSTALGMILEKMRKGEGK